jgi:ribonuclease HII
MPSATPTFQYERELISQGITLIAGVDEVGCGCLAGPVFAAAVILPLDSRIALIRDSKTLSESQREHLSEEIKSAAHAWAIGEASVEEIDRLNIRNAANLAMERAVSNLKTQPQFVLIDGNPIKNFPFPYKTIIKGDRLVKSIAAASIIAKVHRDTLMQTADTTHSGYGFADHKGYGTAQHLTALRELGPTSLHRTSFAPVMRELNRRTHLATSPTPVI